MRVQDAQSGSFFFKIEAALGSEGFGSKLRCQISEASQLRKTSLGGCLLLRCWVLADRRPYCSRKQSDDLKCKTMWKQLGMRISSSGYDKSWDHLVCAIVPLTCCNDTFNGFALELLLRAGRNVRSEGLLLLYETNRILNSLLWVVFL
jgi:hypothetical protein